MSYNTDLHSRLQRGPVKFGELFSNGGIVSETYKEP